MFDPLASAGAGLASASIRLLDHRSAEVAAAIHEVLRPAYAQEAALLGLADFPPMRRSVASLQDEPGLSWGSWAGGQLAGVLMMSPDPEAVRQWVITMLIVHPEHQRQGRARALMHCALQMSAGHPLAVATAEANAPAIALYRSLGFEVYRRGMAEPGPVPMLKFRHTGGSPT